MNERVSMFDKSTEHVAFINMTLYSRHTKGDHDVSKVQPLTMAENSNILVIFFFSRPPPPTFNFFREHPTHFYFLSPVRLPEDLKQME